MKKLRENLAVILAGASLTAATLLIGMIDIKLAKESKISPENVLENYFKSIYNIPYTAIRSFVGLTGRDIATGEDIFPVIGTIPCTIEGMVDQMVYTTGIIIPYKTRGIGEKRQHGEGVIELPTQEKKPQAFKNSLFCFVA
ncbi:hypothetical protein HYT26_02385 [Candidatus Pacearchaeota archaeon]|nr:hypothetical protein [Candidatus Pacearchaeota archaeon]